MPQTLDSRKRKTPCFPPLHKQASLAMIHLLALYANDQQPEAEVAQSDFKGNTFSSRWTKDMRVCT
jgi:hypothetical protein